MIQAREVSYAYPGGETAVRKVSFTLREAESVALLGENGAGKSTLLSLLTGLVLPQSGSIRYDGVALSKKTLDSVRAKVGMVFQNPDDQLFMPTVYEDVAFGLRNLGMEEEAVARRVTHTLERLVLTDLRDRPPYRLSGGEKRRAAIATVVVMQPQMTLFDEPTAFLDAKSRRGLISLLPTLPGGKLIVTHDLALAGAVCTRGMVMQKGSLIYDGPLDAILKDADFLERAGL